MAKVPGGRSFSRKSAAVFVALVHHTPDVCSAPPTDTINNYNSPIKIIKYIYTFYRHTLVIS